MGRRTLTLLAGLILAAGCGGEQQQAKPPPPVKLGDGKLVGIGGGRSLYVKCVGAGRPTVVLEAGFGASIDGWSEVQPALGRTTRTCAYDRAGLGASLRIPGVHDAADEIADLERLLAHARLPAPYVLVGHSYGGLLARLYAKGHPAATAGVVLVDAVGRNQEQRFLAIWRAQPASVRRKLPKPGAHPIVDGVNTRASEALGATVTTLDHLPLVVVTAGRSQEGPIELTRRVQLASDRLWMTMQDELAALSSDHVHVVALRSGHVVQNDQPAVVIRAVRAVVDAARSKAELPPCPRVFPGPGVRCRR